jgi:hypothetical protein
MACVAARSSSLGRNGVITEPLDLILFSSSVWLLFLVSGYPSEAMGCCLGLSFVRTLDQ